jgi:hypothetical protein
MNDPHTFTCAICGNTVQPSDAVTPCPRCGGERWSISKKLGDSFTLYDELEGRNTNKDGDIVAERVQKTDLNTSVDLTADIGKPSKVSVERKNRILGFEEEGAAAETLVNCYNKVRGTSYVVEEKPEEDSDYADRVFSSGSDNPNRVNIQIRHLDTEIIVGISKQGTFGGDRTPVDVIASIRAAIDDKAKVDPVVKRQTILLLQVPAALGVGIRRAIENCRFDHKGFKEIWISPFHEESFPLASA